MDTKEVESKQEGYNTPGVTSEIQIWLNIIVILLCTCASKQNAVYVTMYTILGYGVETSDCLNLSLDILLRLYLSLP